MQVLIVGTGKLASELLAQLDLGAPFQVRPWADRQPSTVGDIVVHAGSGRELPAVAAHCRETGSVLIELSTGSALASGDLGCPVVLCPNTNLLMLKFMRMLAVSGAMFNGYRISVTESHQASKTSVPGTAVQIAESLGLSEPEVVSVRDPAQQAVALGIPQEHLARHAFHRIVIEDEVCRIRMETQVCGASPYADGVRRLVEAVHAHLPLEPRLYAIDEFVAQGWV